VIDAILQLPVTHRGIVEDIRHQGLRCMLAEKQWWFDEDAGTASYDEAGGKFCVATDQFIMRSLELKTEKVPAPSCLPKAI
jgi:hypothetical protein